MEILLILLVLILIAALSSPDETTVWTFTCPHCLQSVTFSERSLAERCKREHRCPREAAHAPAKNAF
jgi:hypothetical protein